MLLSQEFSRDPVRSQSKLQSTLRAHSSRQASTTKKIRILSIHAEKQRRPALASDFSRSAGAYAGGALADRWKMKECATASSTHSGSPARQCVPGQKHESKQTNKQTKTAIQVSDMSNRQAAPQGPTDYLGFQVSRLCLSLPYFCPPGAPHHHSRLVWRESLSERKRKRKPFPDVKRKVTALHCWSGCTRDNQTCGRGNATRPKKREAPHTHAHPYDSIQSWIYSQIRSLVFAILVVSPHALTLAVGRGEFCQKEVFPPCLWVSRPPERDVSAIQ